MAKRQPTPENRQVAQHTARAFAAGDNWTVAERKHNDLPLVIDILSAPESPGEGLVSYATVGLSDVPMPAPGGGEFPTRLELVAAGDAEAKAYPALLAAAAFHIMRSGRLFAPGTVLKNYVEDSYADTTVPHLYLTAPFLWEPRLASFRFASKLVSWLLAMPISDGELRFLEANGDTKFEAHLERHGIDIYDLGRSSAA